jgi:MOSC domain-containing protein YiiM
MGHVISVNVAQPRVVRWKGRDVRTGFFKQPVDGPRAVGRENIEGDAQADHRYHGGPDQAVYAYPGEHYEDWRRRLGVLDLPWGSFGENLTTSGFLEADIRIGDVFQAGSAVLQVTKPREPCYKMNVRFQRDDVVKLFADAERPGFYCRVLTEGSVFAGAPLQRLETRPEAATLVQRFRKMLHRA